MKSRKLYFKITRRHRSNTLSEAISKHFKRFSPPEAEQLILNGNVFVNNRRQYNKNFGLKTGDLIAIYISPQSSRNRPFQLHERNILFEDRYLIVIDKPPGIISDTTRFGKEGTVVEGIENRYIQADYVQPVHRLDKETSGVMVISLKPMATKKLMKQFQDREVLKKYLTVVDGDIEPAGGTLNNRLIKDDTDPRKYTIHASRGKISVTHYKRIRYDSENNCSVLLVTIETGRTHQIRVQLSHLGHPVVGDHLYGDASHSKPMHLHSFFLEIRHPLTSEKMAFMAPPPPAYTAGLSREEILNLIRQ